MPVIASAISSSPVGLGIPRDVGAGSLRIATMSALAQVDHTHGIFDAFDSQALHRIYARAKSAVGERIGIDDEIERRLAVIVLFTFGAEAHGAHNETALAKETAMAKTCVDRLMARTSLS